MKHVTEATLRRIKKLLMDGFGPYQVASIITGRKTGLDWPFKLLRKQYGVHSGQELACALWREDAGKRAKEWADQCHVQRVRAISAEKIAGLPVSLRDESILNSEIKKRSRTLHASCSQVNKAA